MRLKDVTDALERFAPLPLQESYDNAGLQIGLTETEDVSGVLLCLDVTEQVIAEAVQKGCNLIVAHHPLLFRPLKRIASTTYVERCVVSAIRSGVAIYAAHTNLDNAPGGVSHAMARRLGLEEVEVLDPLPGGDGGGGVVGRLPQPMATERFLALVGSAFGIDVIQHNGYEARPIERVALCGGSGSFLLPRALSARADAFLTGEIGYHPFFGHETGMLLVEMGHYESERFTIDLLHDILSEALPGLRVEPTELCTNPRKAWVSSAATSPQIV